MALIPCSDNCIYQEDGYCHLDVYPIITNNASDSCAHKIERENTVTSHGANSVISVTDTSNPDDLNI